jgi:hypothetical protein
MKTTHWILAGVLLSSIAATGCLQSGQFTVSADLPDPLTGSSTTTITPAQIDLNSESVYTDHKDDLQGLVDCAILGEFTNNSAGPMNVTVWMTPSNTNHTTQAQLTADATKVQLWGPFSLGTGATNVQIKWDDSSGLFDDTGKATLINEVKGDGEFTLYAVGATAPYNITITKGVAVITIDAGN